MNGPKEGGTGEKMGLQNVRKQKADQLEKQEYTTVGQRRKQDVQAPAERIKHD